MKISTPTTEIVKLTLEVEIEYISPNGRKIAVDAVKRRFSVKDGGSGFRNGQGYAYKVISCQDK